MLTRLSLATSTAALALWAAPTLAASPAEVCGAAATETTAGRSAIDLAAAATRAEALLTRRGAQEDQALNVLQLPTQTAGASSGVTSPIALARYCAAAGEAMRVARSGSQNQARQYLLAALGHADRAHDGALAARVAYRLGLAALGGDAGASAGSRGAEAEPAKETETTDEAEAVGCAALAQASVLRRQGALVARAALTCAAERAEAAGDAPIAALARLRLARLDLASAQSQKAAAPALTASAVAAARRGLASARSIADPALRADLSGRLAEAALDAGASDAAAVADAARIMRAAQPGDPGVAAFASALEGRSALARGDRPAAAAALQRAVFLEAQRPQPLRASDWLLLLAQAEPARRDTLVIDAFRALESVRPLLPVVDPVTEESNFALRMRPVFQAAVAVQLKPRVDAGADQFGIDRAQQIVEAFRQAELQSAFGSNCVPPRNPVRPQDLRAGELLLYPILLPDRVELIFAEGGAGGQARYTRLPAGAAVSRDEVARLVEELVSSVSAEGEDEWRSASRRLYDILIKPVEGRFTTAGMMAIVPDGPLRSLPFGALMDDKGVFLIEKTRLSVIPALAYAQPGKDRGNQRLTVVAAALQQRVVLPSGAFPKLAGTGEEARAAAGPAGRVLDNFREADLRQALTRGRVDVLHLATHAAFNGRSDRSFIVARDEAIPLSNLRTLIGSERARGDELKLLVLSACETAVGDDQASMGLAGAAVQAGAESAIASLWEVNDIGTVALMKAFYNRYRAGEGRAEALRHAQIALLKGGGDTSRPTVWAAFTLLGSWR